VDLFVFLLSNTVLTVVKKIRALTGLGQVPNLGPSERKGGEGRMKQALSKEALAKEAAFWGNVKQLLMNPGKVCHS